MSVPTYQTYRGLPPLAGLTSMDRAVGSGCSVEESVRRLKRLHYLLLRLHQIFTSRITSEPIYELKAAFSYHAYLCAEHVTAIRRRVGEMREPPLGLEKVPHRGLQRLLDEIQSAPGHRELIVGLYRHAVPAAISLCNGMITDAHPLADAPTIRVVRFALLELQDIQQFGDQAITCLISESDVPNPSDSTPGKETDRNGAVVSEPEHSNKQRESLESWEELLQQCLRAARSADGTVEEDIPVPPPHYSAKPYQYNPVPRRDERFIDSYNAGVNPEAFLYDERFSPRDKTLMMYYKRIRELDVPEMMASILHELAEEPWEFHQEMSRQLWDEARHAMMGEVGFASLGIDWRNIPINFTWSLNLNTQLTARERHGVLYFIEQGLMPRTGKRYEWEIGQASGDPLSSLFQDFDWADEVLHSQIGRRWYVPRFESLQEALAYGDRCWSKILSHWSDYRDQGLTQHNNWWPELYRRACEHWGIEPQADALAFNETYAQTRADLKGISTSG